MKRYDFNINSLTPIFAKGVFNTLLHDSTSPQKVNMTFILTKSCMIDTPKAASVMKELKQL